MSTDDDKKEEASAPEAEEEATGAPASDLGSLQAPPPGEAGQWTDPNMKQVSPAELARRNAETEHDLPSLDEDPDEAGEEPAASGSAGEPATPSSSAPTGAAPEVHGFRGFRERPPGMTSKILGAICLLVIVVVWWVITMGEAELRIVSPAILASPLEVIQSFPVLLEERGLVPSILATLKRVFLGFGLSVLVGVPLGILAASWRAIESFLAPLVLFGRNVPIAALLPLTMLWFGIGESQKVMFIFIATVPFVFSDSAAAVIAIPDRYVETAQTLGASAWQIVVKVLLPLSLPDIYTSLRLLFGLAFGYIMLAELVNAEHGLGYLLNMSQRRSLIEHIVMILLIITLIAYAIDRLLVFFQRGIFPYRKDL